MSLDIHLMCFRNGEPATIKRTLVEEVFRCDAVNFRLPLTNVDYPEGGGAEVYGLDDGDDIQSLMFNHFGGRTFFDALYELARRTKSVILMVTEAHPVAVTDAETISHLPWGFADCMSSPSIVSSGRELADCLCRDC